MFKRKSKSNGAEIRAIVYRNLMLGNSSLPWEKIRSLCTDNETADLICSQIQNNHGINILFRGVITKF